VIQITFRRERRVIASTSARAQWKSQLDGLTRVWPRDILRTKEPQISSWRHGFDVLPRARSRVRLLFRAPLPHGHAGVPVVNVLLEIAAGLGSAHAGKILHR